MNYYKDNSGQTFAYSDIQTAPTGLTKLTKTQVDALLHPVPTLDESKTAKIAANNAAFEAIAAPAVSGYPEVERLSWPQQLAEATAWQTDNTVATPWLTAIATDRGITVAQLVPKVIGNAQAFRASAGLMGIRQKLRDQIDACTTQAELDAVDIAGSYPS